jgi:hypothetical protein
VDGSTVLDNIWNLQVRLRVTRHDNTRLNYTPYSSQVMDYQAY